MPHRIPTSVSAILPAVPQKKSPPKKHPSVSIVGPGNLGSALALTLSSANYPVQAIAVRGKRRLRRNLKEMARQVGARVVVLGSEPLESDVVWLTVPDDAIPELARKLAKAQSWEGRTVFHSSGALTSDELTPLRKKGAQVASVHPMMTFVRGIAPEIAGVSFALEGDPGALRVARRMVADLGGNSFVIDRQSKALYHAFGSFASPLLISLFASMEQVAVAAGIRKRDIKTVIVPLLWQTLRNYLKKDAAAAFSGPLVRGDVTTIRNHLAELKTVPVAREVYVALCRAALQLLPVKNRATLERCLR